MGVVRTILLVAFIIICVLLVLLVLVQNENDNGMGGVFGGGQSAAFGSHSASVLTKTTGVLVALFFIVAFSLALLSKGPAKADLKQAVEQVEGGAVEQETKTRSWLDEATESSVDEGDLSSGTAIESAEGSQE